MWYLSAGILANVQQRVDGFAEQPPCSEMPPTADDTTPEQFVRWVKALPEVERHIAEMRRQYPEFE